MKYDWRQMLGRWQNYLSRIPSIFRIVAFSVAAVQIIVYPDLYQSLIPPNFLLPAVGGYTILRVFYPLSWYGADKLSRAVVGADTAICVFLIMSTGGVHSAFLPYCLAPVLTAALLADRKPTFIIAGALIGGVVASHTIPNPLSTPMLPAEPSTLFLYVALVVLTAALPYLVNVNLRQRLKFQAVLQERQRLSREIHDGAAQFISGIRWQVQLLRRRLAELGTDLEEAEHLERLVEEFYQDTRESLELLRTYTGDGTFLPNIKAYLRHLEEESNIDFDLAVDTGRLSLESPVELQLLRVCQEALTNIRKHSQAHHVQVKVAPVNNHLKVTIADDGCGFDALAYYHNGARAKGHGLAVMEERANAVGGRFRVLSMRGRGTEVQVEVPAIPPRGRWLWEKS
jgi:signal transduction histidine kinase